MSRFRDVQQELDKATHDRLVYPGTGVMLNRLGLRDQASLQVAERTLAAQRLAEGLPREATAPTYDGLKAIHRHLFQDVYAWAGEEREYATRRSDVAAFAPPVAIARNMAAIFSDFRAQGELKGLPLPAFAEGAARFVSAINGVHPFNDGNGRTQRAWLANAAEAAGYRFDLKSGDLAPWQDASRVAFERRDLAPMTTFITAALQSSERQVRGPHDDKADAFLSLTRGQALATRDGTLRAAWKALDLFEAAMTRTFPTDRAQVADHVGRAQAQLADRIRDGRAITVERAAVIRPEGRGRS